MAVAVGGIGVYVGDGVSVGLMVLVGRGVLVRGKGVEAVAHALNKVVKITNPNKIVRGDYFVSYYP